MTYIDRTLNELLMYLNLIIDLGREPIAYEFKIKILESIHYYKIDMTNEIEKTKKDSEKFAIVGNECIMKKECYFIMREFMHTGRTDNCDVLKNIANDKGFYGLDYIVESAIYKAIVILYTINSGQRYNINVKVNKE